ncbi:MAG: phosphatase PAP2 family protein [Anaerolineae bacterium]
MAARWRTLFLVGSGVFLALALAVSVLGTVPPERGLYHWIAGSASPDVVTLFEWINHLGERWVLIPLVLCLGVFLFFAFPHALRQRWWLWAGVMVCAPVLEGITKEIVGRPRPEATSLGFPSGHVTAVTALFVMAAYFGEKLSATRQARAVIWVLAVLPILGVAIARVVLRAHWPLDAVGGAALGLACAAAAVWWYERQS